MRRRARGRRPARIVVVSSAGHVHAPVVFDDLHFRFRPYDPLLAYGQSKTANILFAVGATARWAADGITANALNPGAITTNLQRHVGGKLVTPPERQKTPEQGAATSVLLATSPELQGIGGRYFDDCKRSPDRRRPQRRPNRRRRLRPRPRQRPPTMGRLGRSPTAPVSSASVVMPELQHRHVLVRVAAHESHNKVLRSRGACLSALSPSPGPRSNGS
jgi:hypothetical protein